MAHLASTAPLSLFAAEALAVRLARDAERFRDDGDDDGTLLAARLAEVVSDLPPALFEKVIPHLDWHCALALRKLASSGAVPKSCGDLVACHLSYAQAEVEERARLMLRDNSLSPAAAAAVDKRLILDVYVQHELFVHEPPVGHLLLPAHPDGAAGAGGVVPAKPGERSVVSQWQFQTNWRIFSMGQLEGLDWTGVLVAGGAVLACATTQPAKPRYGDKLLVQHLLRHSPPSALNHLDGREDCATFLALHSPESPTATSDIDLYLYGGDSAAELRAKRVKVVEQILENGRRLGVEMYATRTPAAVTVFAKYPFRSVQIIVGAKAKCAAEVGLDFDLDCCALFLDANTRLIAQGFVPVDDEARLLALPRAMLALNRRCNVLRADKNSYAKLATSRLLKYGDRGFATAITERLFIKPIVGDAHGSSLDDARTVKLLRFAKLQLLSLSVDDCGGDEWCLAGNVTPLNCLRSVLRREMKPQDDIYASAGEFCVAELIKRVLNLDDLTTYAADGVDAKEDHLAFDAQVAENLPVRRRNRYESDDRYTGYHYSDKCVLYGPPVETQGDFITDKFSPYVIRGCPASVRALGGVPATTAQTAEIIAAAQRGWFIAKTDAEVMDLAESATVASHMFNDVSPGVGCHAYACAPQVDDVRFVVDASATSVLRSGTGAVSFDLLNIAGCDWRLDLSSIKNLIVPEPDGNQGRGYDGDALMLALTMVRVSDGVDPMLDTYQTSLWPPLEQCAAEERVRHAYKLLLANIVLDIENPDDAERKLQLDDTYAFPFVRYGADGVNTHINGADVRVAPIAAPLNVPDAADAVDSSPHEHAADGEDAAMEDDSGYSGTADLVPSRTWRNYIYWQFISPHVTADAAAREAMPEWERNVRLVDSEGKLRLRLRLQVVRFERKRNITPFPEPQ